jgi:hypothetical protein
MAAHVKNGPDAFNVFSNAQDTPETYFHYRVLFEISLHGTHSQMSHWPMGVEPRIVHFFVQIYHCLKFT